MQVVVSVRVLCLEGEHSGIRRSIEFDNSLHGQRTIDKVRRFVIDVLDPDDHSLVVGVCNKKSSCQCASQTPGVKSE